MKFPNLISDFIWSSSWSILRKIKFQAKLKFTDRKFLCAEKIGEANDAATLPTTQMTTTQ